MKSFARETHLRTSGGLAVTDITDEVAEAVRESGIRDGELCLGTWQRVLFLELDRERDRRWLVQVVGT